MLLNFSDRTRTGVFFLILAPPFFFTFRRPPWLNYRYVNCIKVLRQTNKNKQRYKSGTSLYTVLRCLHLQCLRNFLKNVKNQYFYDICVKYPYQYLICLCSIYSALFVFVNFCWSIFSLVPWASKTYFFNAEVTPL